MGSAPPVAVDRSQPRAQPAPLVPLAIAGVGGIAAGLALGGPPAAWWGLGGLALVAGLAVTGARSRLLAVLGFAALGLARGTSASPPPPPPDVAPVWDVEVVRAVPEPGREPVPVWLLAARPAGGEPALWRGRARASLSLAAWPGATPGRGSRLLVRGRLRLPGRGGLRLTVARPHHVFVVERAPVGAADRLLSAARSRVRATLAAGAVGQSHGLLLAVVLGDRSDLDPALREAFARTGTAHLLAISGLHVGCCWAAVVFGLRPILRRLPLPPGLALNGAADRIGHVLGFAAATAYVVLAGAPVSARRALGMLAVLAAAHLVRRLTSPWNALAAAALGVCWIDPAATSGLGLALSVVSVAGILALVPPGAGAGAAVVGATLTSAAATLVTAPLCAMTWGRVALAGLWVNPVVIPILGAIAVPTALAGAGLGLLSPALGAPVVRVAAGLAELGCHMVLWLAEPERAPVLSWSPGPAVVAGLYVSGAAAWCLAREEDS